MERPREFRPDDKKKFDSPTEQILQFCHEFGLIDDLKDMSDGNILSKAEWKRHVWDKASVVKTCNATSRILYMEEHFIR